MSASSPQFPAADRAALIEQHRSYVRALAFDIAKGLPPHIELDELIACGNLGLVEAAERYEPRYGVTFQTFAYYRIKGAIYDGLRKMAPLSRTEYARVRFAARAGDLLQVAADDEQAPAGAAPLSVEDEIAAAQSFIEALIPVYLLSLDDASTPEVADLGQDQLEKVEQDELVKMTRALLGDLPDDDRRMIEGVYFRGLSIIEVAAELGVSKSWGSRLHAKAIKHLRTLMEDHGLLDPP